MGCAKSISNTSSETVKEREGERAKYKASAKSANFGKENVIGLKAAERKAEEDWKRR